jgi:hypothetical protein
LIGEDDFLSGIEYLIIQGVIQIPIIPADNVADLSAFVPSWIKDTAGWWAEGLVSDSEFVNGLQYLISKGIITV